MSRLLWTAELSPQKEAWFRVILSTLGGGINKDQANRLPTQAGAAKGRKSLESPRIEMQNSTPYSKPGYPQCADFCFPFALMKMQIGRHSIVTPFYDIFSLNISQKFLRLQSRFQIQHLKKKIHC